MRGRCGYDEDDPFQVTLRPEKLSAPLHWRKPRLAFVDSMGDLFHKDIPDAYIAAVWGVMAIAKTHAFQILTKRIERAFELLTNPDWPDMMMEALQIVDDDAAQLVAWIGQGRKVTRKGPLPNVWLGVTGETQKFAHERTDILRRIPAAVRFVSFEPLLGHITGIDWTGINWAIVGGETGPGARPMHPDWVRDLRDQCVEADVAFFFKQWGEWRFVDHSETQANKDFHEDFQDGLRKVYKGLAEGDGVFLRVGKKIAGRELDGREWKEMPC
jgi:protein gp37